MSYSSTSIDSHVDALDLTPLTLFSEALTTYRVLYDRNILDRSHAAGRKIEYGEVESAIIASPSLIMALTHLSMRNHVYKTKPR